MRKITLKSLLIVALAIIPMTIFAQEEQTPTDHWFIGIEGGATQMFGDNDQFNFDKTSWNAGLNFGYTIKNSIYLYLDLGYVNLKAESKDFFTIDECNLIKANFNIGYDVLQLFRLNPHRLVAIVPHWGLGVMQSRTTTKFADGTEIKSGYKDAGNGSGFGGRRNVFENEFGLNFIFNFSKHFQANIDFVAYKTDTDHLDNVGGAMHNKHNDYYATTNIGLAYKFGIKDAKKCPKCPEVEPVPCDPVPCEVDQKAIDDAIQKYIDEHPCEAMESESDEADETESLDMLEDYEEKDIHLTFKVGKAEVEDNQANRDQVAQVKEEMDNGREINSIMTIGYASPEGSDDQNQKLSEDRAKATADYIQNRLGEDANGIEFQSQGMGSDWDGFYAALENSTIANKAEIAEQIKNSDNPTATLNTMKAKNPELSKLLNDLRRTQVFINK